MESDAGSVSDHLEVGKLSVKKNGYFSLAGPKVNRLTITDATWDADGRLAGTGSGWVGIGDGSLEVEMKIPRADLAYIADHLAGLGVAGAAAMPATRRFKPGLSASLRIHRSCRKAPWFCETSSFAASP